MKKTTILIIGILSILVMSSCVALKTNAIVQCEDTPGIVIETSEPPYLLIETPIDTARQFTILHPDNITEITDFVPAPFMPRFMNCTVNFTVVFPMTANVYTDKDEYRRGETVTYGVENTGNINIAAGCLAIQRSLNGGWKNVVGPICTLLLLSPGEKWEMTWDIDEQVELGSYRVEGGCGSVAYFSIIETTPNVYTNKAVYDVGEIITYGIENTLNYNIGGVSVSIQKDVNGNWEPVVLTYYMPLLLEPGETYESTWDQKGEYGMQVETGRYRIEICKGYVYFSITNIYSVVPPSGDFPVNVTIMNDTGTYPVVIPPGFPWVTPLPVYYLEDG